jgi:hypothetical protein
MRRAGRPRKGRIYPKDTIVEAVRFDSRSATDISRRVWGKGCGSRIFHVLDDGIVDCPAARAKLRKLAAVVGVTEGEVFTTKKPAMRPSFAGDEVERIIAYNADLDVKLATVKAARIAFEEAVDDLREEEAWLAAMRPEAPTPAKQS